MRNRSFIFLLVLCSLALSMLGILAVNAAGDVDDSARAHDDIIFFQYQSGLGADGYDVVAFFTDNKAVKGSSDYKMNYAGIVWHFSSEENRSAFAAAPNDYLPQYGGHCAYGLAQGYLVRGAPQAWSIKDGKLYFNYNKNIRNAWLADPERYLRISENNWQQLNFQ